MSKRTEMTIFLEQRLNDLAGIKTQTDVAREIGLRSLNVMTLYRNGTNKVPLNRVLDLAKALEADPEVMMILALRQFYATEIVDQIQAALAGAGSLGRVTPGEALLLQTARVEARQRGVPAAVVHARLLEGLAERPPRE